MDILEKNSLSGLARCLVHAQLISYEQANIAQRAAARDNVRFLRYLVINKLIQPNLLATCVAQAFDYPYIDLNSPVQEYLDPSWSWEHDLIPVYQRDGIWHVAIEDPTDQAALAAFQFHTGSPIQPLIAESNQLHAILRAIRARK